MTSIPPRYPLRSAARSAQTQPATTLSSSRRSQTGTPAPGRGSRAPPAPGRGFLLRPVTPDPGRGSSPRPVTPELLYSQAVSPSSPEDGARCSATPSSVHTEPLGESVLTQGVDWGSLDPIVRPDNDHGWTPVTRNTARSHRERSRSADSRKSLTSTSPVSLAMNNMSGSELLNVARRYQSLAQEALSIASRKGKSDTPHHSRSVNQLSHQSVQLIDLDEPESETERVSVRARPSQVKGKGADPRNWGGANFSEEFTENDFQAQREAFKNFAEINRVIKQEECSTPPGFFVAPKAPSVVKSSRPSSRLTRTHFKTPTTKIDDSVSGQTTDEKIAELKRQISVLEENETPKKKAKPSMSKADKAVKSSIEKNIPQNSTRRPADDRARSATVRVVPGSFIEKALHDVDVNDSPPPSEPSSSSSSSSTTFSLTDDDGSGSERSKSHRRRKSKSSRRRRSDRSKMLLKPIPPTEYNGSPDTSAFHRFVKEGANYVDVGRVPKEKQVFYLSYYLKGKARNFYDQKVVKDQHPWTLSEFFWGLFNFCFPLNFREKQRARLSKCVQNDKSVSEHVAEWEQIYNMIGLEDNQEKVVMLWRSFRADVRREMYRDKLDPEVSTWDEVMAAAEQAEVIVTLGSDDSDVEPTKAKRVAAEKSSKRADGGRVEMKRETEILRSSSAELQPGSSNPNTGKKRSLQRRNEMLAKGLCFNCEEHGHLARNCPKTTVVTSKERGKPPGFGVHTVNFEDSNVLAETTEVLETFSVGAASFFDARMAVEEGEGIQENILETIILETISAEIYPDSSVHDDDYPGEFVSPEIDSDLAAGSQSMFASTESHGASSTDDLTDK